MVKFHKIKPNRITWIPRRIVYIDTEAAIDSQDPDHEVHKFRLGYGEYVRYDADANPKYSDSFFSTDPRDFWGKVLAEAKPKKSYWVLAHNWHYDFFLSQAPKVLPTLGWELDYIVADSQTFLAKLKKGEVSVTLVDLANYFGRYRLEDIGKSLGLEKPQVDFLNASEYELKHRVQADVRILRAAFEHLLRFWVEGQMGKFGYTISRLAWNNWRHRFYSKYITVHRIPEVLELEKASYRGGRVQAFRRGDFGPGEFYLLDISSFYPYIMYSQKFPIALLDYRRSGYIKELEDPLHEFTLIAEVVAEVQEPVIAVRKDGHLTYPVGRIRAVVNTAELLYIQKMGWDYRVLRYAIYRAGRPFRDYVKHWFQEKRKAKKEGNEIKYRFTKLMLNSLFGKFGQKKREYVPLGPVPLDDQVLLAHIDADQGIVANSFVINGIQYVQTTGEYYTDAFPAISAEITAYGRVLLWEYIKTAGLENVYYCDTDSIIVDAEGLENLKPLLRPGTLGGLEIREEAKYLSIRAPRVYALDGKWRAAGMPSQPTVIDPKQPVIAGNRWLRARSLIKLGILDRVIVKKTVWRARQGKANEA